MIAKPSATEPEPLRRYFQTWAETFVQVLQQLSAADGRATLIDEQAESANARQAASGGLLAVFDCSGKLAGRQRILVSVAGTAVLGRVLTGETGEPSEEAAEVERNAATELLRQVAGMAAGLLKEMAGGEVQVLERQNDYGRWEPAAWAAIRLDGVSLQPLHVVIEVDEALALALRGTAPPDVPATGPAVAGVQPRPEEPTNLRLLLDIELEASIRFGQRELLLKDVLNLRPGTVVELARQVNEPAELLVGGRLMARGEVVVVEGNYGLRIIEILAPAERMAMIRG